MPLLITPQTDKRILSVSVGGSLVKADYERFVPEFERLAGQHGKLRLLFEMVDFHGWTVGAAWEDIKFGFKHFSDIDRIAMVGESKWQKGMAVFCQPFTRATVRYFDRGKATEARTWLGEGQRAPSHPVS